MVSRVKTGFVRRVVQQHARAAMKIIQLYAFRIVHGALHRRDAARRRGGLVGHGGEGGVAVRQMFETQTLSAATRCAWPPRMARSI